MTDQEPANIEIASPPASEEPTPPPAPGAAAARIIRDMPLHQYLSLRGVASHDLREIGRSPAHYRAAQATDATPSTPSQVWGTALHQALMGGDNILIMDSIPDRRSNAGKAAYAEMCTRAGPRDIITADDYADVERAADALLRKPGMGWGITSCEFMESVIAWERDGQPCKARPDAWGRAWRLPPGWSGDRLIELKSTRDARPYPFQRDMMRYGYVLQLAWYMEALAALGRVPAEVLIVAVENEYPHESACYRVSPGLLEWGKCEVERLWDLWLDCTTRNHWPGYDAQPVDVWLPPYLAGDLADDE